MPSLVYNLGSTGLNDGSALYLTEVIEVILVKSTYTPNQDDTNAVFAAAEISGVSGYTGGFGGAGRKALGTKTVTNDTTNNRSVHDAADPTAWTLGVGDTIGGAIIAKKGAASDATAVPIFYLATGSIPTNGSTFTLQFHADGIGYTQN